MASNSVLGTKRKHLLIDSGEESLPANAKKNFYGASVSKIGHKRKNLSVDAAQMEPRGPKNKKRAFMVSALPEKQDVSIDSLSGEQASLAMREIAKANRINGISGEDLGLFSKIINQEDTQMLDLLKACKKEIKSTVSASIDRTYKHLSPAYQSCLDAVLGTINIPLARFLASTFIAPISGLVNSMLPEKSIVKPVLARVKFLQAKDLTRLIDLAQAVSISKKETEKEQTKKIESLLEYTYNNQTPFKKIEQDQDCLIQDSCINDSLSNNGVYLIKAKNVVTDPCGKTQDLVFSIINAEECFAIVLWIKAGEERQETFPFTVVSENTSEMQAIFKALKKDSVFDFSQFVTKKVGFIED